MPLPLPACEDGGLRFAHRLDSAGLLFGDANQSEPFRTAATENAVNLIAAGKSAEQSRDPRDSRVRERAE
jgi:hypothetical protein